MCPVAVHTTIVPSGVTVGGEEEVEEEEEEKEEEEGQDDDSPGYIRVLI